MKLKMEFDPDLVGILKDEIKAGEHAVTAAMKEAGSELKTAWREQISSAAHDPKSDLSQRQGQHRCGGVCLVECAGNSQRP